MGQGASAGRYKVNNNQCISRTNSDGGSGCQRKSYCISTSIEDDGRTVVSASSKTDNSSSSSDIKKNLQQLQQNQEDLIVNNNYHGQIAKEEIGK